MDLGKILCGLLMVGCGLMLASCAPGRPPISCDDCVAFDRPVETGPLNAVLDLHPAERLTRPMEGAYWCGADSCWAVLWGQGEGQMALEGMHVVFRFDRRMDCGREMTALRYGYVAHTTGGRNIPNAHRLQPGSDRFIPLRLYDLWSLQAGHWATSGKTKGASVVERYNGPAIRTTLRDNNLDRLWFRCEVPVQKDRQAVEEKLEALLPLLMADNIPESVIEDLMMPGF